MSLGSMLSGGDSTLGQLAALANPNPQAQGGPQGGQATPPLQANAPPSVAPQSPPDLVQLYLKLYQQDRNADMIDRGLAGVASAFAAPGTQGTVYNSLAPTGRDPSGLMNNIVSLAQMQRFNQARPAIIASVTGQGQGGPGNLDPAVANAMTNDQLIAWMNEKAKSGLQVQQQGAEDKQKNLIEAQAGLADTQRTLGSLDANIDAIKSATNPNGTNVLQGIITNPSKQRAAMTIMNSDPPKEAGAFQQWWHAAQEQMAQGGLSQPEIDTIMLMKQTKGQQYADALNSIKGGRRTQVEIGSVAGGLSQIGNINQGYDDGKGGGYLPGLDRFQQQIRTTIANAYGEAGQLDQLDPKYRFGPDGKPLVNQVYHPGGPLYGGQGGDWVKQPPPAKTAGQPATITGPADIAKLPKGAPFIIPSGPNQGKIGYAQ